MYHKFESWSLQLCFRMLLMFVALGAISSVSLHAQTRIHAHVVERDGTELPYALVSIYLLPDSTLVDYTSTNQKGEFAFSFGESMDIKRLFVEVSHALATTRISYRFLWQNCSKTARRSICLYRTSSTTSPMATSTTLNTITRNKTC